MAKADVPTDEEHWRELMRLLDEVRTVMRRTAVGTQDFYLHYNLAQGWRARFWTAESTKQWITSKEPGRASILDAVRTEVAAASRIVRKIPRTIKRPSRKR